MDQVHDVTKNIWSEHQEATELVHQEAVTRLASSVSPVATAEITEDFTLKPAQNVADSESSEADESDAGAAVPAENEASDD